VSLVEIGRALEASGEVWGAEARYVEIRRAHVEREADGRDDDRPLLRRRQHLAVHLLVGRGRTRNNFGAARGELPRRPQAFRLNLLLPLIQAARASLRAQRERPEPWELSGRPTGRRPQPPRADGVSNQLAHGQRVGHLRRVLDRGGPPRHQLRHVLARDPPPACVLPEGAVAAAAVAEAGVAEVVLLVEEVEVVEEVAGLPEGPLVRAEPRAVRVAVPEGVKRCW
jgi:hypothetical protein